LNINVANICSEIEMLQIFVLKLKICCSAEAGIVLKFWAKMASCSYKIALIKSGIDIGCKCAIRTVNKQLEYCRKWRCIQFIRAIIEGVIVLIWLHAFVIKAFCYATSAVDITFFCNYYELLHSYVTANCYSSLL